MIETEELRFDVGGLTLVADAAGPQDAPVILFLHGSGQTRGSWRKALLEAAKRGLRGIALDLRGHGESDWAPNGEYALPAFTEDLRHVVRQIDRPPIVVGASLGGLVGLLAASGQPKLLRALILVDITTKIEIKGAQEVVDFMGSAANGFASLDEAADAVAAYLPHRKKPKDPSGLARNLRQREDGRYYWHWDPAFHQYGKEAAQRGDATDDLDAAARKLELPVLLVRGGQSTILSPEGAKAFLEIVPHAEFADIAGAHHMVAGDANDAFNEAVFAFVDKQTEMSASAAG